MATSATSSFDDRALTLTVGRRGADHVGDVDEKVSSGSSAIAVDRDGERVAELPCRDGLSGQRFRDIVLSVPSPCRRRWRCRSRRRRGRPGLSDDREYGRLVPALPSLTLTSLTESVGVDARWHGFSGVARVARRRQRGGEVRRVVVRLRAALSAAELGGRAGECLSGTGTFEEVGVAVADEVDDLGQLAGVARLPSAAVASERRGGVRQCDLAGPGGHRDRCRVRHVRRGKAGYRPLRWSLPAPGSTGPAATSRPEAR